MTILWVFYFKQNFFSFTITDCNVVITFKIKISLESFFYSIQNVKLNLKFEKIKLLFIKIKIRQQILIVAL